ncbi:MULTISPECIES: TetR/AcrR family transcriptional regulator [Pseudomonas]|uniref:TetR family transcriptional regulator n=2 Tax=Ectopseudomonas TaxID=3236654 RepID=A0A653B024_ECTOL|nr:MULTISPECIES: TetR family transcriptional regulator [Pseudomonas]TNF08703.1 MAG: TetR family transcriptional regulator [Pseudomonadales bacterium]CAE6946706.1 TetR family transcriptional regulator [Pseudomonas oleovorans]QFT23445.1 putative DNA-binding transcriptional regulator [Pseudomonas sp. THAF187a]QFT43633.1 putative DNA-binding transcriptional regulator [Pseudomonas sp. THAF42]WFC63544.1 TetR family transcriptional regulator [Pseudomonas sp. REST10]
MSPVPASPNASQAASAVVESVQYQGRKASRQGSEQRRQAILDAAMRIIVRDGVRSVRHRAVAAEAQVPLSATTYYFKDIDDLITDTFAQFVERSAAQMAAFWAGTQGVLQELVGRLDGSERARRQLADEIAELAVQYVQRQLRDRRDHLIAEQAFQQEALLNPRLSDLVRAHRQILQQGVTHFFEVLGSRQPEQDAVLLTATIMRMEYQGLLDGVEHLDSQGMLAILKRYMNLVLGL